MNFLNYNLLCWSFDISDIIGIILNIATLIVTCIINARSLYQTRVIHRHSANIDLYDKRKVVLDKVIEDKVDVSCDLELLFGQEYYLKYREIKKLKKHEKRLFSQLEKLEEYFENINLYETYQELLNQDHLAESTALYDFYKTNTYSYYDNIEQQTIALDGNVITRDLLNTQKLLYKKKSMFEDSIEAFIIKSINLKI